ncbi:MAG: malto-oligosyltrehalose synthase, partial [Sciscionella sp.]
MSAAPSSTYRVQLRPEFGFAELGVVADYLASLGVCAVYTSPLLAATPGSTHGYDVVDPKRVAEQLGGEDGRRELVGRLRERGLDLVLDIVPNHMGIERPEANPWWWDVLANGRESRWASFFDIDFDAGPILVPVLADDGDDGKQALDDLAVSGDRLTYHEHRFPISDGTSGGSAAEVHGRQHYRLVSWRRAAAELNYRRFFDIDTLAAVRVEYAEVFAETHAEVLRWVVNGEVHGLRIDHPDGLTDPGGYLRRLREHAPSAWLVVEKILAVGETLPANWPVDGTTGYDALRECCGVLVDPAGEAATTRLAVELCGAQDLSTLERDGKRFAASSSLRAEVLRIARLLPDFPLSRATSAVAELLASFRVYRSYLPFGRAELEHAAERARGAHPEHADVLAAVVARMLAEPHGELADRVQQISGMVMAKGIEDTTFYRYPRLVALNEVGGDPSRFGASPTEFHAACALRASSWP